MIESTTRGVRGARTTRAGRGGFGLVVAIAVVGLWPVTAAWAVAEGEMEESAEMGDSMEMVDSMEMEAAAKEAAAKPAPSEGTVPRARFTSAVVDREPTDQVEVLGNDTQQVSYFSELSGLEGRTVTHVWKLDGEVKAEVPFDVKGPRWRVHSSKNLDPSWLGEWTVSVVDEDGRVLRQDRFTYSEETPETAPAAPAPASDVP